MTSLPKYLTQDELKRFFAAIESPRDRALFGLIYHYDLRVGFTRYFRIPTPWETLDRDTLQYRLLLACIGWGRGLG
jgi:hypothetical protein